MFHFLVVKNKDKFYILWFIRILINIKIIGGKNEKGKCIGNRTGWKRGEIDGTMGNDG